MIYFHSFIAALIVSGVLTIILIYLAKRFKVFLPAVRDRDQHKSPTPRIGGIAIILSVLSLVIYWQLKNPAVFAFSANKILGMDRNLFGLLCAIGLISIVNLIDDWRGLPWQVKMISQILASLLVIYFGIKIPWLTNPFGGTIHLGWVAPVFLVIWLVGLSNAINWLDGLDGLAGGVSLITLAIIFVLSISPNVVQKENALLAVITLGALAGFLPFNLPRARAFLGDTGAVFLGFMVGVLAVISGGKIVTAFLVLAIPFMDALTVVILRLINHQSPFKADRRHLFHRLLDRGLKEWQILAIFYLLTFTFGMLAIFTQSQGKVVVVAIALIMMIALTVFSLKIRKLHVGGILKK